MQVKDLKIKIFYGLSGNVMERNQTYLNVKG